jgi:hypothetical protein
MNPPEPATPDKDVFRNIPPAQPGEDFPVIGRVGRVFGWWLCVGLPTVVLTIGVGFILSGAPLVILVVVVPLPLAIRAAIFAMRRYGATVTGWDNQEIRLKRANGSEEMVSWDAIEWFKKLWLTHKLEGGGRAWVAVLVKYRTAAASRTALLTVSGAAAEDSSAILPGPYETVFDRRIPHRTGRDRV